MKKTKIVRFGQRIMEVSDPLVMAIVNATPDSFYAESSSLHYAELCELVDRYLTQDADIIDIGGMSSRPGAEIISAAEEQQRIAPILEYCKEKYPTLLISVDTLHSETAGFALSQGATIINDISGGMYDSNMASVVAEAKATYVCMHMRGTPSQMKSLQQYKDMMWEILQYFAERIEQLRKSGVEDIILDPGFGFAKNISQNYHLLSHLHQLHLFDYPILVGLSRKSMVYKVLQVQPEEALLGTTAVHMLALLQGVSILRVHDVNEVKQCIRLYKKYQKNINLA